MLSAFLAGVLGGLLYCLPLSAVNVEIIRRGLTNGFVTALIVSMGALVGDVLGRSVITPYAWWTARFGLWPLWALGLGVPALALLFRRRA